MFWQNPEPFYNFTIEPELCCVVLERAQSDWGRDSACSFQEAEGRSWKAAAELLLHVNGHGQDLELGFSKQKSFEWNWGWFQRLFSRTVFANSCWKMSVLWSYHFSTHKYTFLSQTDWPAVRLHAHHIATGSRGTSLLLHAYSVCIAQNHAIVVGLGSITCAHTAYNKPRSCRTLACTGILWCDFSLRIDQTI